MKHYLLYFSLAIVLLGCGQIGPLYLPDKGPPPVYVPKTKTDKAETKATNTKTSSQSEQEK